MNNSPLAEILRPKTLDDVLGQEHLTGKRNHPENAGE
jgi:putative ATPase